MDIKSRRVARFRTQIDPMIGEKPRNAFDMREFKDAIFEITPIGVYVKMVVHVPGNAPREEEHIVPYANVQSIKLAPLENDK